jgi:Lon protease-like protein
MMSEPHQIGGSLREAPLFPLPNVVLFPRAVLPLHIFEERYKAMTADAMEGDRQIAMALLRCGWEKDYYAHPAIEPVVCVGTIVSCEKLPDGKYNFLLQGHTRARIVRESTGRPYRVAELVPLEQSPALEIDLSEHRAQMSALFNEGALSRTTLARQFRHMLEGPFPTADIADLIAFNLIDDVCTKQELLAQTDVRARVERAVQELGKFHKMLGPSLRPDEVNLN